MNIFKNYVLYICFTFKFPFFYIFFSLSEQLKLSLALKKKNKKNCRVECLLWLLVLFRQDNKSTICLEIFFCPVTDHIELDKYWRNFIFTCECLVFTRKFAMGKKRLLRNLANTCQPHTIKNSFFFLKETNTIISYFL